MLSAESLHMQMCVLIVPALYETHANCMLLHDPTLCTTHVQQANAQSCRQHFTIVCCLQATLHAIAHDKQLPELMTHQVEIMCRPLRM